MPFTTTFANLSARGFGLFGKKRVLTTVTFPSGTTTWTAPPSVSNLLTLVGKGQDGSAGGVYPAAFFYTYQFSTTGITYANPAPVVPVSSSCTYDIINYINSLSGLQYIGGQSFSPCLLGFISAIDGSWVTTASFPTDPVSWTGGGWVIGGTAYLGVAGANAFGVGYDAYAFPFTGANTTAFGYTFPGGVEVPASTITYNNVAVTPGATYTIVNNGSVTITYYV